MSDTPRREERSIEEGQIEQGLREAERLKSEFLANMAHELRTPLNAVIGFAALLHEERAGPVNEVQRAYLADVLTSSRQLLRLINDLVDLAKVDSGKLQLRPEVFELQPAIRDVCAILRGIAAEKRIQVDVSVDATIGTVTLDPVRTRQILYNLVSNALKFTPGGGSVSIVVTPGAADTVRIDVTDTGVGIRPEDLHRLFVEFQRLDGGAPLAPAGAGLGLALTRGLVAAQGGTLSVESALGTGSRFTVVLPR